MVIACRMCSTKMLMDNITFDLRLCGILIWRGHCPLSTAGVQDHTFKSPFGLSVWVWVGQWCCIPNRGIHITFYNFIKWLEPSFNSVDHLRDPWLTSQIPKEAWVTMIISGFYDDHFWVMMIIAPICFRLSHFEHLWPPLPVWSRALVRPYLPNFEAMLLQKRAPVARRHAGPDCPARNCYNVVEQRLEQRPLFWAGSA